MVNILEHELVPAHEVLPAKDTKELLEGLGITKLQLPHITEGDSVVKAIEAKVGDVLRITRKSSTAGKTIYYRVVV